MADLKELNFDLSLTGFEEFEIQRLLSPPSEDEILPEPAVNLVTQPGDLWICDGHRVMCGDSTSPESVSRLLGQVVPNLMVTDAPYGVSLDPTWRERAGLGKQQQEPDSSPMTIKSTGPQPTNCFLEMSRTFGTQAFMRWRLAGLHAAGFELRSQIIWAKQHFAMSRGDFHWQHEPCWYCVREGKSSNWSGDRRTNDSVGGREPQSVRRNGRGGHGPWNPKTG